jgi:hypothetical protein
MNSNIGATMILATSLWAGIAALAATGGPAPRSDAFWMSQSPLKAKDYPRLARTPTPSKLAAATQ